MLLGSTRCPVMESAPVVTLLGVNRNPVMESASVVAFFGMNRNPVMESAPVVALFGANRIPVMTRAPVVVDRPPRATGPFKRADGNGVGCTVASGPGGVTTGSASALGTPSATSTPTLTARRRWIIPASPS